LNGARVNTQVKSISTGAGETARVDPRELLRMLEHLELGDVVTVTRIDRLARSTFDPFSIVKRIVDAKASSDPWRNRGPTRAPAPGA
jgi:DNA invertase Pin-like site-specific DNA recombinase